jgi:hypothetical protein
VVVLFSHCSERVRSFTADAASFAPGAQDLLQPIHWGCLSGVTLGANSLTITAGNGYNTVINTSGPSLQVQGDFSVLAQLSAPTTSRRTTL